MTICLAPLLSVFLTACAAPEPLVVYQRVYERQSVPDSLLRCAEEPAIPGPPVTEFAALAYIARLRVALLDCHYRMAQLRGLLGEMPIDSAGDLLH